MKLCKIGIHLHVVSGTGCMGDGLFCLDCGLDKYPESFPPWRKVIRKANHNDWKVINDTRICSTTQS